MNRPILTVVRGLPGSGKSTFAHYLSDRTGTMLLEPDALLMCGGVYHYTPERYRDAVQRCFCILSSIGAEGRDIIYADVLPTIANVKAIIRAYDNFNWIDDKANVRVMDRPMITVEESLARNTHAVRREDIERMAKEWEPWEEKNDE